MSKPAQATDVWGAAALILLAVRPSVSGADTGVLICTKLDATARLAP